MRFYIASRLENAGRVRQLAAALTAAGWELTYDWAAHGSVKEVSESCLRHVAFRELVGALTAELVIVLLPGGRGTHTELGFALAAEKDVVVHSEDPSPFRLDEATCAFYWLGCVERWVCPFDVLAAQLLNQFPRDEDSDDDDGEEGDDVP